MDSYASEPAVGNDQTRYTASRDSRPPILNPREERNTASLGGGGGRPKPLFPKPSFLGVKKRQGRLIPKKRVRIDEKRLLEDLLERAAPQVAVAVAGAPGGDPPKQLPCSDRSHYAESTDSSSDSSSDSAITDSQASVRNGSQGRPISPPARSSFALQQWLNSEPGPSIGYIHDHYGYGNLMSFGEFDRLMEGDGDLSSE